MAVLDPLKVVITNYPEGQIEYLDAENNENRELGTRKIAFKKYLYRTRRLTRNQINIGNVFKDIEVRLYNAYFIKCTEVFYDENGEITHIHATYDPKLW